MRRLLILLFVLALPVGVATAHVRGSARHHAPARHHKHHKHHKPVRHRKPTRHHKPAAVPVVGGPVTGRLVRSGAWITDPQGRVVVMHGVDLVKKLAPYYFPQFGPADAEFLANEGFTAARIGVMWAGDEPQPGVYDETTIGHILSLNALLTRYGVRTLLDAHQDLWGGNETVLGDGMPAWASLGLEFEQDFADFWNNATGPGGVGIQTRFDAFWAHVIGEVDTSFAAVNVLGVDPLNEPQAGSGYSSCHVFGTCPAFESTQLPKFYDGVIASLRGAGYRGVIFPESIPGGGASAPALPGFADPQTDYNYHYYCTASQFLPDPSGLISVPACASQDATYFPTISAYAAKLGVPYIVSEFGSNDADAEYANQVGDMDARFLTWMYWMYYNDATGPANFPTEGLLENDNEPGSVANAMPAKLAALVVPYAEAVAGTPGAEAYDHTTHVMTLTYGTHAVPGAKLQRGALTQIFVPQLDYPDGYAVTVTGARVVSAPGNPWVELQALTDAHSVSVTVSPSTGGTTELPSQTGAVPSS
jgi:endoglycosylceramidase